MEASETLSQIVGGESGAARRNRRLREIATALRYAAEADPAPEESDELLEFVLLALKEIEDTVQQAVAAWEKRDYWVKADRFRSEWVWVSEAAAELERALAAGDVSSARAIALGLAGPMHEVKPYKSKQRRPWSGASRNGASG